MECLNIDFIGPFPDKGYILVMIDTFTRFVELYATKDATAKAACTALVEHVGRYGSPRFLRSDNGPHFAITLLKNLQNSQAQSPRKFSPILRNTIQLWKE